jgi:hypothetical protein
MLFFIFGGFVSYASAPALLAVCITWIQMTEPPDLYASPLTLYALSCAALFVFGFLLLCVFLAKTWRVRRDTRVLNSVFG